MRSRVLWNVELSSDEFPGLYCTLLVCLNFVWFYKMEHFMDFQYLILHAWILKSYVQNSCFVKTKKCGKISNILLIFYYELIARPSFYLFLIVLKLVRIKIYKFIEWTLLVENFWIFIFLWMCMWRRKSWINSIISIQILALCVNFSTY